jgi:hypothetical protein
MASSDPAPPRAGILPRILTPWRTDLPKSSMTRPRIPVAAGRGKAPAERVRYPGALIVVEGIDGSGKSTQLYLLKRWLEIRGYKTHFTEWNSSPWSSPPPSAASACACSPPKPSRSCTPPTSPTAGNARSAPAPSRLHRPRRPLRLHRLRPRRRPRLPPPLAAQPLQLRARRPTSPSSSAHPSRSASTASSSAAPPQILRSRPGPRPLHRSRPELQALSRGASSTNTTAWLETDNFVRMDAQIKVNTLQKQVREIVQQRIALDRFKVK